MFEPSLTWGAASIWTTPPPPTSTWLWAPLRAPGTDPRWDITDKPRQLPEVPSQSIPGFMA